MIVRGTEHASHVRWFTILSLDSNQPTPSTKPTLPSTTVYHYVNPQTNEHVASLLSPDHPEMICLQAGGHIPQVKFGILGAFRFFIFYTI
jgi:hypothetical protein